jgi:hypothetical protein
MPTAAETQAIYDAYAHMGRTPDDEGLAYWSSLFDANVPYDVIANEFNKSAETVLAREAAQSGLTPGDIGYEPPPTPNFKVQDLVDAYNQSVGAGLATEAEFVDYARSQGVTDTQLLQARDQILETSAPSVDVTAGGSDSASPTYNPFTDTSGLTPGDVGYVSPTSTYLGNGDPTDPSNWTNVATTTAPAPRTYDQIITDAYARIGRTGEGLGVNQIDPEGKAYWLSELESGRISPESFDQIFNRAVQDYIAKYPDNPYSEYVDSYLNPVTKDIDTSTKDMVFKNPSGLAPGDVGYIPINYVYLGGDPTDPSNWGPPTGSKSGSSTTSSTPTGGVSINPTGLTTQQYTYTPYKPEYTSYTTTNPLGVSQYGQPITPQSMVDSAYAGIGRYGMGSQPNQIDPAGYQYWNQQLSSGAVNPNNFFSTFNQAVQNYQQQNPNDPYTLYTQRQAGYGGPGGLASIGGYGGYDSGRDRLYYTSGPSLPPGNVGFDAGLGQMQLYGGASGLDGYGGIGGMSGQSYAPYSGAASFPDKNVPFNTYPTVTQPVTGGPPYGAYPVLNSADYTFTPKQLRAVGGILTVPEESTT